MDIMPLLNILLTCRYLMSSVASYSIYIIWHCFSKGFQYDYISATNEGLSYRFLMGLMYHLWCLPGYSDPMLFTGWTIREQAASFFFFLRIIQVQASINNNSWRITFRAIVNVHSLLSQKSCSEDQKHILMPAFRYCSASSSMTVLNIFLKVK